jgi:hypothetical protein
VTNSWKRRPTYRHTAPGTTHTTYRNAAPPSPPPCLPTALARLEGARRRDVLAHGVAVGAHDRRR